MINVVAGLLYREGKLLVCQRRKDSAHSLKWEFPGGKVEPGESDDDALRRELQEELNIEIDRPFLIHRHEHQYPGGAAVTLSFYRIKNFSGDMRNLVFEQIAWIALSELLQLDFLEGDIPLVRQLDRDPGILFKCLEPGRCKHIRRN